MSRLTISVVVCTRNRSDLLDQLLGSLVKQITSSTLMWEVVVVDNVSEDDTRACTLRHQRRGNIDIKYVLEKELGLSRARNTGLAKSMGEIVAFVDDDATVHEQWLEQILASYEGEDIVSVGGVVVASELLMSGGTPQKGPGADENGMWKYRTFDQAGVKREVESLRGSNMSFRRDLLEGVGGFNVNLGRVDACRLAGDENDIFLSLRAQSNAYRFVFNPAAIVYHPSRLSVDDFERKYYCGGISRAIINQRLSLPERLGHIVVRTAKFVALKGLIFWTGVFQNEQSVDVERYYYLAREKEGYLKSALLGRRSACKNCPLYVESTESRSGGIS